MSTLSSLLHIHTREPPGLTRVACIVLDEQPIKGTGGDEADRGTDGGAQDVDVEGGVEEICVDGGRNEGVSRG